MWETIKQILTAPYRTAKDMVEHPSSYSLREYATALQAAEVKGKIHLILVKDPAKYTAEFNSEVVEGFSPKECQAFAKGWNACSEHLCELKRADAKKILKSHREAVKAEKKAEKEAAKKAKEAKAAEGKLVQEVAMKNTVKILSSTHSTSSPVTDAEVMAAAAPA